MKTHVFTDDDGQAVRLPAEVAYAGKGMDVEVMRNGETITIFPLRQNLKALADELRRLPAPSEIEIRDPIELPDRGDR